MPLLEIKNLAVSFKISRHKKIHAVRDVSLYVDKGEIVGLVGESGCGKTTLSNAVMRLVPWQEGRILFSGEPVDSFFGDALKRYRRKVQMIFQDPYGSLNPRMSVGAMLKEVLSVHKICEPNEMEKRVCAIMELVGLDPKFLRHYPHEFSGGQRQRLGIARALALEPELVIADEPVSALDVSVQVQILNLMKELKEEKNFSYLLIAHDLAVIRYMCSRVYVMYKGTIVEHSLIDELIEGRAHPYTMMLIEAVPDINRALYKNEKTSASDELSTQKRTFDFLDVDEKEGVVEQGCVFYSRCPFRKAKCKIEKPALRQVGSLLHHVACHFAEDFYHKNE